MQESRTIYEVIGKEKLRVLVHHFYEGVRQEPELKKLYPADLAPAEERLYLFLVQIFGGPPVYSEKRGHPMLRKRHFAWPINGDLRNKWLNCMFESIDQSGFDKNIRETMAEYFVKVANHMINQ